MEKKKKKDIQTNTVVNHLQICIFVLGDENINFKTYHILESHNFMKKWV